MIHDYIWISKEQGGKFADKVLKLNTKKEKVKKLKFII